MAEQKNLMEADEDPWKNLFQLTLWPATFEIHEEFQPKPEENFVRKSLL